MNPRLLMVVILALVLRLVRAALRWDEVSLAYVAYQQPGLDALAQGRVGEFVGSFFGLHPPLYTLLLGAVDLSWGAPAGWLLLSVACSGAAVWVVGRSFGAAAALVLALDPLQLAYCAEVNNYPLLVLLVALLWQQRERAASGQGWVWLALVGVAAGWAHMLGGVMAGLCALSLLRRDPRAALGTLGVLALGCAPVVLRGLSLAGGDGAYGQLGLDVQVLWHGVWDKLGLWVALWGLSLLGGWRRPALLGVAAAMTLVIALMLALGVAAPHQQPYWLVLGPLQAGLLAALGRWGLPLVLAVGGWMVLPDAQRLQELQSDQERQRGIDAALASSAPGDALWLLAPALMPDDDKRDMAPALHRLSPWKAAPAWRGPGGAVSFEFTDYGFGQPRWLEGRVVHTSTDIWPDRFDAALGWHLGQGREVWLVLYDHSPAHDYEGKVDRALRPYLHECLWVGEDRGLGRDRLCRVKERL